MSEDRPLQRTAEAQASLLLLEAAEQLERAGHRDLAGRVEDVARDVVAYVMLDVPQFEKVARRRLARKDGPLG